MLRIFFTGAFRKPRELNWVIGVVLLHARCPRGLSGYSLPDDLLSGTGLRILDGMVMSIPVVGTYLSFLVSAASSPATDRHSAALHRARPADPGYPAALIAAAPAADRLPQHTQFAGPGPHRAERRRLPVLPVFIAKRGFFFVVFGIALMAGLLPINPIWHVRALRPAAVHGGLPARLVHGLRRGALRIFPGWETHARATRSP